MTILKEDTELKPRQKKYVRRLAETGKILKSATDVGYRDPRYGSQLMMNPKILTALQKELDALGVDKALIVRKIKKGLNATRVIKDGGKKYPDFHAQHKFLDMLLKIRGDYAPEKHEIKQERLVIVLGADMRKGLIDAEAITEEEADIIEAEIVEEESNA